jgi:hypothetical protein
LVAPARKRTPGLPPACRRWYGITHRRCWAPCGSDAANVQRLLQVTGTSDWSEAAVNGVAANGTSGRSVSRNADKGGVRGVLLALGKLLRI